MTGAGAIGKFNHGWFAGQLIKFIAQFGLRIVYTGRFYDVLIAEWKRSSKPITMLKLGSETKRIFVIVVLVIFFVYSEFASIIKYKFVLANIAEKL